MTRCPNQPPGLWAAQQARTQVTDPSCRHHLCLSKFHSWVSKAPISPCSLGCSSGLPGLCPSPWWTLWWVLPWLCFTSGLLLSGGLKRPAHHPENFLTSSRGADAQESLLACFFNFYWRRTLFICLMFVCLVLFQEC